MAVALLSRFVKAAHHSYKEEKTITGSLPA
jgi:hypothetical protein